MIYLKLMVYLRKKKQLDILLMKKLKIYVMNISNKCITSKGPGTSFDFGFDLAKLLFPKDEIEKLQDFMIY